MEYFYSFYQLMSKLLLFVKINRKTIIMNVYLERRRGRTQQSGWQLYL